MNLEELSISILALEKGSLKDAVSDASFSFSEAKENVSILAHTTTRPDELQ